jgi:hypothetical protein
MVAETLCALGGGAEERMKFLTMKQPYTMCGSRGEWTFQRNPHGQISYKKHSPRDPKSAAQRFVRMNFGEVSVRWQKITEPQRQAWCVAAKKQLSRRRLGKRYPLFGYYYYMRINVALANRGQPLMDLPPQERQPAALSFPLLTEKWYGRPEALLALTAHWNPLAKAPVPLPSG